MSPKEEMSPLLLPITAAESPVTKLPSKASPSAKQPHSLLGIACVAASAVCFSVMSTFVKYDTSAMTSVEAVFWRSFIACILNYGVILYRGQSLYVKPEDRKTMLYRVISGFASIAFQFYAISQMVLADASVIIFTSPVITFFLGACLLHEHIDLPSFLCAITSFAGLVCVVRPGFLFGYNHDTAATDGSWIAVGSGLLGAVGQAFVYIYVRKLRHLHVQVIIHHFMFFSIIVSLLYIALFQRRFVIPSDITMWTAVIGSGVFTFIGQTFLTKGFQLEKAGIASVMRYLDVVCVFVWDAVFLHERINHWSAVGAAIICVCAAIIALRKSNA
uniref:EamA domain-containing protein n=1 Tax=Globisporangium ultimum (strain ATCC 200006 / CBS 805.95 / DAOM BR144) TaxID=431595 RepID=K3X109_GLOUD